MALFSFRDLKLASRVLLQATEELGAAATATAQRWLLYMPESAKVALRRFLQESRSG